jgi:hypothetical protein
MRPWDHVHTAGAADVELCLLEIDEDLDILSALLELHQVLQARKTARVQARARRLVETGGKEQQHQAAVEHRPLAGPAEPEPATTDRDPGWDF